jgi:hypothetical protein
VLRIEGQLDVARLQHALQQIVDRHDILRTTFHFPAGHSLPVQAVSPDGRAEWHELDLLACDADEQRAQFEARRKQDFREPFQLAEGSLLRATLVALTASEYVLVFTLPALCADSASLSNIAKEIHFITMLSVSRTQAHLFSTSSSPSGSNRCSTEKTRSWVKRIGPSTGIYRPCRFHCNAYRLVPGPSPRAW